jgi:hypothetical protein
MQQPVAVTQLFMRLSLFRCLLFCCCSLFLSLLSFTRAMLLLLRFGSFSDRLLFTFLENLAALACTWKFLLCFCQFKNDELLSRIHSLMQKCQSSIVFVCAFCRARNFLWNRQIPRIRLILFFHARQTHSRVVYFWKNWNFYAFFKRRVRDTDYLLSD